MWFMLKTHVGGVARYRCRRSVVMAIGASRQALRDSGERRLAQALLRRARVDNLLR
jgi:hypothetical protein